MKRDSNRYQLFVLACNAGKLHFMGNRAVDASLLNDVLPTASLTTAREENTPPTYERDRKLVNAFDVAYSQ